MPTEPSRRLTDRLDAGKALKPAESFGEKLAFYGVALRAVPKAMTHYRRETLRLLVLQP